MVHPDRGERNLNRDRKAGILLVLSALAGVLVMAVHPTGHAMMQPGAFGHTAHVNVWAHGLAIASLPVIFLGLLAVARRLAWSDCAIAGLVVFGFGLIAVASAAIASGFVATEVVERMLDASGAAHDTYDVLLEYTHALNQGYARVNVGATSVGMLLFSIAILKTRLMPRALGILGAVVGAVVLVALLAGHFRLDVHGYGLVILLQTIWLVWAGIVLMRPE
ncbi:MAG TPA: hypothetical protein VFV19_10375 [Candidatus Polarisedimenticolaceae bacterium]|nr:hypothetical protein [Candidatus Polarisedimenticolaceae bacterium]